MVDGNGLSIYPGFIDGGTDLGLNEPGVRNYDDVNEMLTFNQMLRTRVACQSDSDAIPVARVEGITSAAIVPGGGTWPEIPVMNLDGWTWEENTLPSAGLAMTFPGGGGGGRWWWRRRRRRGRGRPDPPARRDQPHVRSGARV